MEEIFLPLVNDVKSPKNQWKFWFMEYSNKGSTVCLKAIFTADSIKDKPQY